MDVDYEECSEKERGLREFEREHEYCEFVMPLEKNQNQITKGQESSS